MTQQPQTSDENLRDAGEALRTLGRAILAEQPFRGMLQIVYKRPWVLAVATAFVLALMALDCASR